MKFLREGCDIDARLVSVVFVREDGGIRYYRVSSLSRPGVEHEVMVECMLGLGELVGIRPEDMIDNHYVRCWSSDEFFQYGGCAYNLTMLGCAIYPYYRAPRYDNHDYIVSHTLLAVLSHIGRGYDKFSVEEFNFELGCYE